jgi:aminopyrrolnitrin oxygenase
MMRFRITLPRVVEDFGSYLRTKYALQRSGGSGSNSTKKATAVVALSNETGSLSTRTENQTGATLAPGWYVVCSARELKRLGNRPKDIQLFGRAFTLFRGSGNGSKGGAKTGRPYLVSRFCPHQGASLTRGKVVGDNIRCEFHHWQFAGADGACTLIPASGTSDNLHGQGHEQSSKITIKIPRKARIRSVPLIERNGMLFAWYPGDGDRDGDRDAVSNPSIHPPQARPAYELPVLVANPEKYYRLDFTFHTRATARRILENLWDADHIPKLHGLPVKNGISLEILSPSPATSASASADDASQEQPQKQEQAFGSRKLLVGRENWFAIRARAELKAYIGLSGRLVKLLGVSFNHFDLTVEACPTLGVATIEIDREEKSRNILAITPIADGYSLSRLVIYVRKTGSLRRDLANLLLFGLQNYLGGLQDVLLWNHLRDLSNAEAVATAADKPFYLFRRFYARASASATSAEISATATAVKQHSDAQ